jgi:hypothetical protein
MAVPGGLLAQSCLLSTQPRMSPLGNGQDGHRVPLVRHWAVAPSPRLTGGSQKQASPSHPSEVRSVPWPVVSWGLRKNLHKCPTAA